MSENYIWTNNTVVYNYFPTNVLGSYSPTGMHSVNALLSPTCSQLGFKPYEVLKQPPRRVQCSYMRLSLWTDAVFRRHYIPNILHDFPLLNKRSN